MPAKPTAPQAQLLKRLSEGPTPYCIAWGNRAIFSDEKGTHFTQEGPLNLRTLMACKRMGWIESFHSPTQDDWSGGFRLVYRVSPAGLEALRGLPPDFLSKSQARRVASLEGESARVMRALAARHEPPDWVFVAEPTVVVPRWVDPRHGGMAPGLVSHQMDALALSCFPSGGYKRVGYEIKVSRSDFMRERAHPEKTAKSAYNCSEFYFACPKGVLRPGEIPDPYGLVVVYPNGRSRIIKRSTVPDNPATWGMLATLLRRVVAENQEGPTDG